MRKILILLVVGVAALIGLPLYFQTTTEPAYQGWVEADMLFIGAESGGRLSAVHVVEGDKVGAGDLLFALDDKAALATVTAAQAQLGAQEAQLELAMAQQKRPEEISMLQASQRQAEARLSLSAQQLERIRGLAATGTATRANLDTAIAEEAADRAGLDQIREQIVLARLPMRDEAVRQARELLAAARAELDRATDSLERLSVHAPEGGTVQTVYYRAGEVVPSGRPVVSLLSPGAVRIRFFVAQSRIASLALGQTVHVTCDGCQPTTAHISFIAATAEYTPPEIYSIEERAKLVYRIEAVPEKPERLRPGQPVDVRPAPITASSRAEP